MVELLLLQCAHVRCMKTAFSAEPEVTFAGVRAQITITILK